MVQTGRGLRSKPEGAGLTQSKPYLNWSQKARSRSFCSVTAQTIRINADPLLASSLKHDRDAAAKPCHKQKK